MMHNTNCQIKFKAIMLKSRFCDYSDAYLLVKGTITITRVGAHVAARQANESGKEVILKYSKTSGSLLQYYWDELYDTHVETIADSESLKFKAKVTRNTPN